jgi:hypothetical protein
MTQRTRGCRARATIGLPALACRAAIRRAALRNASVPSGAPTSTSALSTLDEPPSLALELVAPASPVALTALDEPHPIDAPPRRAASEYATQRSGLMVSSTELVPKRLAELIGIPGLAGAGERAPRAAGTARHHDEKADAGNSDGMAARRAATDAPQQAMI